MINRLGLLLAGTFLLTSLASAQTLFGVTGADGDTGILYRVNTSTGATTQVGPVGFNGIGALAFAPDGTTLYGLANSGHRLIRINTATGAGTAVSGSGTGTGNIADMAFRSDGVLFAVGGGGEGNTTLYTINTTTGVATTVGTVGNTNGGNGLAFHGSGTLFLDGFNGLYTINTTTGVGTLVAIPDFNESEAFNQAAFAGMKFNGGVLYGTTLGQLGTITSFSSTPIVNFIGNTGVALEALAFGNASAPPPTTPAPSSLLLLGTALAIGAGWFVLRGRTVRS